MKFLNRTVDLFELLLLEVTEDRPVLKIKCLLLLLLTHSRCLWGDMVVQIDFFFFVKSRFCI